jgi:hypothetical protein
MSEEEKPGLSREDALNRLAAAEIDLYKIADHTLTGHHPDLNET